MDPSPQRALEKQLSVLHAPLDDMAAVVHQQTNVLEGAFQDDMAQVVQPIMDVQACVPRGHSLQMEMGKQHNAVLAPLDPIQPKALVFHHCAQLAMWGHIR